MVPTRPAAEVTLMIRPVPSSARNGNAAWLTVNVPPTWMPSTSWNCSGVILPNIAGAIAPALLTRMLSRPSPRFAACSAAADACSASRTSTTADSARPPDWTIASATAAAASLSTSVTTTAAPAAANARATAAPMPLPAPVTSAVRPAGENGSAISVAPRQAEDVGAEEVQHHLLGERGDLQQSRLPEVTGHVVLLGVAHPAVRLERSVGR